MKQKIFSKGNGWYISATNYKDKEDKCYINLYFPKDTEPTYTDNGRGFSAIDIDIEEMKFTSYKGKAGATIFKYKILEAQKEDNSKFGYTNNLIEENDLPFY